MNRVRVLISLAGLLLALVAWGCSGAGDESASDPPAAAQQQSGTSFQVTSPDFTEIRPRRRIPIESTCYGAHVSPALDWSDAPAGTESFALLVEDIDHSTGRWVHWVLYDIPADATGLTGGVPTSTDVLPDGTTQGTNDDKNIGYNGPCPPPLVRIYHYSHADPKIPPHRYEFTVYALDAELGLPPGTTKAELVSAMEGHILAQAVTMGKYTTPAGLKMFGDE